MQEKEKTVKVLQIVPLGTGGITSLVLNIADHLDTTKVRFDYLNFDERRAFNEEKALKNGSTKYTVPINRYKNKLVRAVYKFFKTIKEIRRCNPDILHINGSFSYDIVTGISAKIAGVPKVVFHSHNSNMADRRSLRKFLFPLFQALIPVVADCYMTCSDLAAEFMFPKSITSGKKYITVKNGIEVKKYRFDPEARKAIRERYGLHDQIVFGHIGRFTRQKNHLFLIDIFSEISKRMPDAVLMLIGVGELEDAVKEKVGKLGLEEKVIFVGATQEVPAFLCAMDCFLFPSLFEGLPVVGVEVQASGLPIVMSDVITDEVVITDLVSKLSLSESAQVWAETACNESRKKNQRSSYADQVAAAGFDIQEVTENLIEIYRSLAGK